jgi:hypothetical protein
MPRRLRDRLSSKLLLSPALDCRCLQTRTITKVTDGKISVEYNAWGAGSA